MSGPQGRVPLAPGECPLPHGFIARAARAEPTLEQGQVVDAEWPRLGRPRGPLDGRASGGLAAAREGDVGAELALFNTEINLSKSIRQSGAQTGQERQVAV